MAKLAALAAVAALAARGVAGDACYDKQVPVRSLQSSRVPELMDFDEWALKFGKVRLVGRLPRACATRPVPLRVSAVSPPPPAGMLRCAPPRTTPAHRRLPYIGAVPVVCADPSPACRRTSRASTARRSRRRSRATWRSSRRTTRSTTRAA